MPLFLLMKQPKSYNWVWVTQDLRHYKLRKMTRPHVQNSLNWCIRRTDIPHLLKKDGHTYQEWIAALTMRLLDPNLP